MPNAARLNAQRVATKHVGIEHWAWDLYDVAVYGPNGFFRQLTGSVGAGEPNIAA